MLYKSTRGCAEPVPAAQAILTGIAPDGGLYVPEKIPLLPLSLDDLPGRSYQEVASHVIGAFFDDFTKEEIAECVAKAYGSGFKTPEIVPVREAGGVQFMELYHGRTSAFKDMALSILPHLLTKAPEKTGIKEKICILTATSGDTGKAALAGFAGVPGTDIVVFFPEEGVSRVQRLQMVTQEGTNTHVFAIRGNFDRAQRGVKEIFTDGTLQRQLAAKNYRFSSANSINIGRLVPQVAYYVYAYGKLLERGKIKEREKINVVVPTGNFGNILAAYYAGRMGIPVGRLICASNENDVLTEFLRTGVYNMHRPFHITTSPSMDILVSSNLERLLFALSGENAKAVRLCMDKLQTEGSYAVSAQMRDALKGFYGGSADMGETADAIGVLFRETGYVTDPHTAVAYRVFQKYRKETGDETVTCLASTASPYKFPRTVLAAVGGNADVEDDFAAMRELSALTGTAIPENLSAVEHLPIRHQRVINPNMMKEEVLEVLR